MVSHYLLPVQTKKKKKISFITKLNADELFSFPNLIFHSNSCSFKSQRIIKLITKN